VCVWKEGDEKVEEREVRRDEDEGFSVLGSSKLDFLQWPHLIDEEALVQCGT
jgi:hypothetical protein